MVTLMCVITTVVGILQRWTVGTRLTKTVRTMSQILCGQGCDIRVLSWVFINIKVSSVARLYFVCESGWRRDYSGAIRSREPYSVVNVRHGFWLFLVISDSVRYTCILDLASALSSLYLGDSTSKGSDLNFLVFYTPFPTLVVNTFLFTAPQ